MNNLIFFTTMSLLLGSSQCFFDLENKSISKMIKDNITEFNKLQSGSGKSETFFREVSAIYNVLNEDNKHLGEIIFFDDNDGYIFIGNDNVIRNHNYECGFSVNILEVGVSYLVFDGINYYDNYKNLVHSKIDNFVGGSIDDHFYWHGNTAFMTQKERELLTELSPEYDTLAKVTSSSTFGDKIMWSHYQTGNNCAQVAIANLLWSYKLNDKITLPTYCGTYDYLLEAVTDFVPLDSEEGTLTTSINIINDMLGGFDYVVDYVNVANGISDTLKYGPMIGFYAETATSIGHFAMVTGKGRSVYQKILGIPIYTSWDIVNSWHAYDLKTNGYITHKYWVDNQYIYFGWQLEYNSTGYIVPLINA